MSSPTPPAHRNGAALANVRMITASAGTGKTHSLMGEIAGAVKNGAKPSQILATTFTKKAAAELVERVQSELFGQDEPHAARQMSVSMVGTVNSVCGRLLQEYAIDAGLSPALQVVAEDEQLRIFQLATDNVFAQYTPRIQPLARMLGYDGEAEIKFSGTDWRTLVRAITDAARSNRIDAEGLAASARRSWSGLMDVLGPAGDDERQSWMNEVLQGILGLRGAAADLAAAGKNVPKNLHESIGILEPMLNYAGADSVPWRAWIDAAGVPNAAAKRELECYIGAVEDTLLENPSLQEDLQNFTTLIFECAALCLQQFADFKRQYGLIDFTDQETLVVGMLENNESFRSSISQRIKFMVVDEFQDTSPLQLQLFTKFAELVERVVWVGDSKQAIYEFRGTDPELMKAVAGRVEDKKQLQDSWRSKESVIELSNEVFLAVFPELPESEVKLQIPEARKEPRHPKNALGGHREAWLLDAKKSEDRLRALGAGVADLIERRGFKPSEVAVLARSNDAVAAIAAELTSLGLKASTNTSALFGSREIQLVRAGMAFVASGDDTVALAELAHLHPDHPSHGQWVSGLLGDLEPAAVFERWASAPLVHELIQLRDTASFCTPTEIMEEVIARLGIPRLIKSWSNPATRLKNLDGFRALLENYYDSCAAMRKPATLSGSLKFLAETKADGSENFGTDVVNVLTYHKAKGLEWPAVVLAGLDRSVTSDPFGLAVEGPGEIDVRDPLAHRWIRFWPYPFGGKGFKPLSSAAVETTTAKAALVRRQADSARVLYVGMTRSVAVTCMAAAKPAPGAFNTLAPGPVLTWTGPANGRGTLVVQGRTEERTLPIETFTYAPAEEVPGGGDSGPPQFEDRFSVDAPVAQKPARVTASSMGSQGLTADVAEAATLGPQLIDRGAARWNDVGSAIHGYLALPIDAMAPDLRAAAAARLLDRWGVSAVLDAAAVVEAGDRMLAHFAHRYPGSRLITEQSVAWRNADNQLMEGWIDLLIETPDGYVLVDHKSYPGKDPIGHIRDKYVGQMRGYAAAIQDITGQPVLETLIHMPALGKMFRISN